MASRRTRKGNNSLALSASRNVTDPAVQEPTLIDLAQQVQQHGVALNELKGVPDMLQSILKKLDKEGQAEVPVDSEHDDFEAVLLSLDESMQDGNADDNDETLKVIMESIDQKVEVGPPINDKLAEGFSKVTSTALGKEVLESLKEKEHGRVPSNCLALQVPRVNPEIWGLLPVKGRVIDVKSQGLQQSVSVGLCSFARLSNELVSNSAIPKDVKAKLLKIAMDGGRSLGSGFYELSMKRRMDMKPYIQNEYSEICSSRHPVSEFLFGSNLAERLKECKNTSDLIRKTSLKPIRPKPYSRPSDSQSRPGPLNFNRPPFPNFRRGGGRQSKFTRPFQQTQKHRP